TFKYLTEPPNSKEDRWNKLFEELSHLREFKASSKIEGQKLASKSIRNVSEGSLRLLEQEGLAGKSSSEAEDVDSNKEEDHADSSEEEDDDNEEEMGDEDEADSGKESVEEEEEEDPINQLYKLYYKKFNKHEFDYEEKGFLKYMMKRKACIKDKLLGLASKLLLKEDMDDLDDMMLK
ncbi:hypothetical protein DFQ30_010399, partial [Apophysomyces sp. BC1015]